MKEGIFLCLYMYVYICMFAIACFFTHIKETK